MKKLLFLFILMLSPMLASADDGDTFSEETVEGVLLKYTIISESEKTCMVGETYYPDVPTARVRKGPEDEVCQASGDITIPEEASGYRVVRVESFAFNQAAITSVFIPNSVKTIGNSAFTGCADLKSVRLSEQLTRIEGFTFSSCESLTNIDIPEGVISIGDYAFANCKQLKEITIPSCVEHFGEAVFWNTGFTSLPKLPESLTTIPKSMFYECTQLTSIEIPENITYIDDCAFGRCPMAEIDIPASVTRIGVAAFANCKNITDLTIPNNVTEIGMNAFLGCSNLKTVTLSNNISGIREGSFKECTSLESVVIPNGLQFIGKWAFLDCSSLSSIDIPETVEEIGEQAFANCTGLIGFNCYAKNVPKAESNIFYNTNIKDITLHVPASSVSAYKAVEPWKNFKEIVALPAQDDYRPLVEEGKVWNVAAIHPDDPSEAKDGYYDILRRRGRVWNRKSYIIEGDTVIGGVTYKKLLSDGKFVCGMREEEGRVYRHGLGWNPDSETLVYDFNAKLGDVFKNDDEDNEDMMVQVKRVSQVNINGQNRRCLEMHYYDVDEKGEGYDGGFADYWIEGIGCTGSPYYPFWWDVIGNYPLLLSCYDGEECIFNIEDFNAQITKNPVDDIAYRPLVEEGKVWTYHYHSYNGREFNVGRVIDGDTIIGGLAYKKIYDKIGGQYQYALREEGKKVYIVYPHYEAASLLYDFSKNAGDVINELAYPLIVASVDTIDIDGVKFRRMRVQDADQPVEEWNDDLIHMYNFWIEGVGSESLLESSIREVGNAYNLISCQINGRVYTQQELLGIASKPTPQDDYRPFVEDGKVWKVVDGDTSNPVQVVDYYYFDGDTIIDGKTCKQMMRQQYVNPDHPDYEHFPKSPFKVGTWYEEDKKVYFYDEGQQSMVLKYDFSLEANDTLKFLNIDGYIPFIIGPKQAGGIKGFKGVYRDIMICAEKEQNMHYTTWLEGVGDIEIPTRDIYYEFVWAPNIDLKNHILMSCTVGDEVIYLNDEYEDGATPEGARKKRFDFTHTIKIQPKSRIRRENEQLLYGEYNDLQLGIHLDPLDDDYQVSITDESGKVVYEKAVNAGSIVGLNIDISAYAEGSYTVTVENGQESFTGMFDTQTTGIKEIINNKEKGMHIYNLQGQRLSSLQKGLNIVNGKKIFMTHDN